MGCNPDPDCFSWLLGKWVSLLFVYLFVYFYFLFFVSVWFAEKMMENNRETPKFGTLVFYFMESEAKKLSFNSIYHAYLIVAL